MAEGLCSVGDIAAIYRCAADRSLFSVPIDHKQLRAFHLALRRFYRSLGENARDEFWAPLNTWGWGYLRRSLVAPLPLDHPMMYLSEQVTTVRRSLRQAIQIFPDFEQEALALLDLAEAVARSGASPMVEALRQLEHRERKQTVLVLPDARLVPAVRSYFETVPELAGHAVLKPSECRINSYQRMVLAGGAAALPPFLLTAPRAMEVYVLHYWWLPAGVDLSPVFAAPLPGPLPAPVSRLALSGAVTESPSSDDEQEATELFPRVMDRELVGRLADPGEISALDKADALALILEGGLAAALDKPSSAMVIDLEAPGGPWAGRMRVPDIEPGMFLLLRTDGGNYLVPIADQLLGVDAPGLRRDQSEWKRQLRKQFDEMGLMDAVRCLKGQGSQRAIGHNVRTWVSEDNICTREFGDFAAIMRFIHRPGEAERLWSRMEVIRQAHHRAGQVVRRKLEDEVKRADLAQMAADGFIAFHLPEYGVSLTAYRVERILPDPVQIPRGRLGRILDLEEPEWHV